MKIEDGIMDPPRRMRLHSRSFCLFRHVARGGGGGGGGGGYSSLTGARQWICTVWTEPSC